eukprot:2452768-Rhodomonas_salina.2
MMMRRRRRRMVRAVFPSSDGQPAAVVAATQEEAAQTAATREERISNATRELEEKQEQSRRQAALVSKLVGEGENLRDEVRRCAAATQRLREAKDKVESKRSEGQRHSLEVEQFNMRGASTLQVHSAQTSFGCFKRRLTADVTDNVMQHNVTGNVRCGEQAFQDREEKAVRELKLHLENLKAGAREVVQVYPKSATEFCFCSTICSGKREQARIAAQLISLCQRGFRENRENRKLSFGARWRGRSAHMNSRSNWTPDPRP